MSFFIWSETTGLIDVIRVVLVVWCFVLHKASDVLVYTFHSHLYFWLMSRRSLVFRLWWRTAGLKKSFFLPLVSFYRREWRPRPFGREIPACQEENLSQKDEKSLSIIVPGRRRHAPRKENRFGGGEQPVEPLRKCPWLSAAINKVQRWRGWVGKEMEKKGCQMLTMGEKSPYVCSFLFLYIWGK